MRRGAVVVATGGVAAVSFALFLWRPRLLWVIRRNIAILAGWAVGNPVGRVSGNTPTQLPNSETTDADSDEEASPSSSSLFSRATKFVAANSGCIPGEELIAFYGLYKQATCGKCQEPRPSILSFSASQKWESWNSYRRLSREEAELAYVRRLEAIFPDFSSARDISGKVTSFLENPLDDEEAEDHSVGGVFGTVVAIGDVDSVRAALKRNPGLARVADNRAMTALHWSADRGHTEIAKLLLSAGADVNAKDSNSETPLHLAILAGETELAALLIERGADRDIQNNDGETPAQMAEACGGFDLILGECQTPTSQSLPEQSRARKMM